MLIGRFAQGLFEGQLILSVRTCLSRGRAGEILRQVVVGKMGRAGGHDRRASGFVELPSTSAVGHRAGAKRAEARRLLKALYR